MNGPIIRPRPERISGGVVYLLFSVLGMRSAEELIEDRILEGVHSSPEAAGAASLEQAREEGERIRFLLVPWCVDTGPAAPEARWSVTAEGEIEP